MAVAHGHERADLRNLHLHLHRRALEKLAADPGLRERCLVLVDAWLATPDHAARPWLLEWRAMLADWPLERIVAVVLDPEGGQTLRQCSPLGNAGPRWQR